MLAGGAAGIIVANAQGTKRDESLGVLNTSALPAGNYAAFLDLYSDGVLQTSVARPFTLIAR
jgi:hypothetical protein